MLSKVIFLSFLICGIQGMFQDKDVFHCDEDVSDEQLSEEIIIQPIDKYIFLILSPVAFFCTLFITFTFIKYPKTRKMPSDIVFFISLSDCILCIHWFVTALYFTINGESPLSSGPFCQINSLFSIFAGTGEVAYNIVFCLYVRITLKNQFKSIPKLPYLLHSLAWIAMILAPTLALVTNKNGLSLFGTCSFKYHPGFPFAGILLVLGYTIVSCYTIYYFKNAVPDDEKYLEEKNNFAKYYYRYIVASCIIWTTEAVCFSIAGFNCSYFHKGWLQIFITIGNTAKLCTPMVLSILRYNDPTIKKSIGKVFKKFWPKRVRVESESVESLLENPNCFESISQNLRYDQVNTIIFGIRQICKINSMSVYSEDDQSQFNIQRRITDSKLRSDSIQMTDINKIKDIYGFNNEDVVEEISYDIADTQEKEKGQLKLMKSTIIVYAPKIFEHIRQREESMVNLYNSFDPIANQEQIKHFKGPDGGKGGAFFFFTHDNKLIIKTISDQELVAFRKKLIPYFLHITENKSTISPIYGIFSFKRQNISECTHVMVMRNAMQIPQQYKLLTYDIKGSTHSREVLKPNQSAVGMDLRNKTLKDLDFQKQEKGLNIDAEIKEKLKQNLIKDAQFFAKVKFMDYSLLIIKMDWKSYLQNYKIQEKFLEHLQQNLWIIDSTKEEGVKYHISIIDYLQEWNAQKKFEKHTKKVVHANIALDTSAQSPEDYAQRFIKIVAEQMI